MANQEKDLRNSKPLSKLIFVKPLFRNPGWKSMFLLMLNRGSIIKYKRQNAVWRTFCPRHGFDPLVPYTYGQLIWRRCWLKKKISIWSSHFWVIGIIIGEKLLKFHETPYFSTLSDFPPIGCKSPKKATQIPVWSQYHTEAWEEQLGSEDEGAGKHLSG